MSSFLEFEEDKKKIKSINLDNFSIEDLEEYIDDLQREKKVCNKLNYENVKKLAGINVGWTSIYLLSVMLTSSIGFFIFREKK